MNRKAILVVSFGTSHAETRKIAIEACEERIRKTFPEYDLRRAFTSERIIGMLRTRDRLVIDTPEEALLKLQGSGYTDVIVQPLQLIPGFEFHDIVRTVKHSAASFERLRLGRPLLSTTEDYIAAVDALKGQFPEKHTGDAIVFMGHGTRHPANAVYAALERMFEERGCLNVFVGTIDAYPSLDDVIRRLRARGYKGVALMPLLQVAGIHARKDMASDEPKSWKSRLTQAGFQVRPFLRGLGENPGIQELYTQHVREATEVNDRCLCIAYR